MIPKKIHYFWFSGDPLPKKLRECFESWKSSMPDFELKKWDLSNSPIDSDFAKRALSEKKWAFLTDYCRFKVLHEEGGIYLDSDVFMLKTPDELLSYNSFWSSTDFGKVDPFVFGCAKGNYVVQKCIEFYENYPSDFVEFPVVPDVIESIFNELGYHGDNSKTFIKDNNVVLPYEQFCPMPFNQADEANFRKFATENTLGIHLWNTSWNDPFRFFFQNRKKSGWKAIRKAIWENPIRGWSFYKNVLYHLKCGVIGYPKQKR